MPTFPLKQQLIQITKQLAYTAYGLHISLPYNKVQLLIPKSTQQAICYKLPLPQLIYEHYSKDGFIYSDPGTTPKQIAEDMIVHFRSAQHIKMESDQFGNILAIVQQQYFSDKYQQLLKNTQINYLQCSQSSYKYTIQRKQPIVQKDVALILFRENQHKITLSQLRQQLVFQVIKNIENDIYQNKVKTINVINSKRARKYQLIIESSMYSKLLYGCLRHQTIKRESQLQKLLNTKSTQQNLQQITQSFKFGIVIPQSLEINIVRKTLSLQQLTKLKQIFYDFSLQKPINLTRVTQTNNQFKSKLSKKLITLPTTLQQLFLTVEQLTAQHRVIELYHFHLLLQHLLNSSTTSTLTLNPQQSRYKNAAKIINDHLYRMFFG